MRYGLIVVFFCIARVAIPLYYCGSYLTTTLMNTFMCNIHILFRLCDMNYLRLICVMFISIFVSEDLYSHCVVALSLCRYVGFPLEKNASYILSGISVLAQSNYIDGRSSTALFSVLVDGITP